MGVWIGVVVLGAAIVISMVVGLLSRHRAGRVRVRPRADPGGSPAGTRAATAALLGPDPAPLTLLQFSTRYCASCRGTAQALTGLAAAYPGGTVAHVEVDVTDRPDIVRAHRLTRSPTTLVVDPAGAERARVQGPVRAADLRAVVDGLAARTGSWEGEAAHENPPVPEGTTNHA